MQVQFYFTKAMFLKKGSKISLDKFIYKALYDKNKGYYKYIKDPKCYTLFQKLYQMYIDYDKYIYMINGKQNDIFDKNKMDILLKRVIK